MYKKSLQPVSSTSFVWKPEERNNGYLTVINKKETVIIIKYGMNIIHGRLSYS